MNGYLENIVTLFKYYKSLGDKALKRCEEEKIGFQFNEDSNSMITLVLHMSGNMLSRWTDFLTTDGEKPWRNRDAEFENVNLSKSELIQKWEEGWKVLFEALATLHPTDLQRTVYIRNESHTVLEAINRQLAHYSYHVGQMVFLSKAILQEWESLSIARNKSQDFNKEKFNQGK